MKTPKNMGASVRQRLLDYSRARSDNHNQLLTRYAIERLLYRLSCSPHRDLFVLKGASLYAIWQSESDLVNYRPTRDLDFWSSGAPHVELVIAKLREVVATPVEDDGITFSADSIKGKAMRENEEYPGCKIEVMADLNGIPIRVLIDFGFGDAITPAARTVEYPTILDFPSPLLQVYPRETVIAEKFEAMVFLNMTNTRLKDFYDLLILSQGFSFDGQILSEALRRTFERRQTPLPTQMPVALTERFSLDEVKMNQWKNFGKTTQINDLPPLHQVAEQLQRFLLPVAAGAISGNFEEQWTPQSGWLPRNPNPNPTL